MAKMIDPKAAAPALPVFVKSSTTMETRERFQCDSLPPKTKLEDETEYDDDEDGFQCPCCLAR